jgi:hypothetical protein
MKCLRHHVSEQNCYCEGGVGRMCVLWRGLDWGRYGELCVST